jgi:hypothetical protein
MIMLGVNSRGKGAGCYQEISYLIIGWYCVVKE